MGSYQGVSEGRGRSGRIDESDGSQERELGGEVLAVREDAGGPASSPAGLPVPGGPARSPADRPVPPLLH